MVQENSSQFFGKDYLQTYSTTMETKIQYVAVSFANIFMAKIETEIINHRTKKALEVNTFIEQANRYHHAIKFTAEISDRNKIIAFLDTPIYRGAKYEKKSLSVIRTLILNQLRAFNTSLYILSPIGSQERFRFSFD